MSRYKEEPNCWWAVCSTTNVLHIYRKDFRCMKQAMLYANRLRERGHKLIIRQYKEGELEQYMTFWSLAHV